MKKQSKYRLKCYPKNLQDALEHLLEEVYLAQHIMYVEYNGIFVVAQPGDTIESLFLQYERKMEEAIEKHMRSWRYAKKQHIYYKRYQFLQKMIRDEKIQIKKGMEREYQEYKNINFDPLSFATVEYADRLARALQVYMREGSQLEEVIEELIQVCDLDFIAEYMADFAISSLSYFWEYGDVLAGWLETPSET